MSALSDDAMTYWLEFELDSLKHLESTKYIKLLGKYNLTFIYDGGVGLIGSMCHHSSHRGPDRTKQVSFEQVKEIIKHILAHGLNPVAG